MVMKVKNVHRSIFSNWSNWKDDTWKNQGVYGIRTRDPRDTGAMLYQHNRYRGGHGFESRWIPEFFQASSFQLLKLENILRWSFFTFLYNRSSSVNYLVYSSHYVVLDNPCSSHSVFFVFNFENFLWSGKGRGIIWHVWDGTKRDKLGWGESGGYVGRVGLGGRACHSMPSCEIVSWLGLY